MKIKLFYQKHNESLDDFEYRVNLFTLSVSVIDIKFQEALMAIMKTWIQEPDYWSCTGN